MSRVLDVLASILGLLLSAPFLFLAAVWVRLTSAGPVLFRQERIGAGMRPFTLYKFRTMTHRAGGSGPCVTAAGDARITPGGRFLRRFKLDELPQLWNVLRGDMGLVGARPEVPAYVARYPDSFARILVRRPGLVDPATLHFVNEAALLTPGEDPEREYLDSILPRKLAVSEAYIGRRTVWTDLGVIAATLPIILFGEAAAVAFWRQVRRESRYVLGLSQVDLVKLMLDLVVLAGAGVGAWFLAGPGDWHARHRLFPWWIAVQGLSLFLFGVPSQFWKFFGFRDARRLAVGAGLGILACAPFTVIALGVEEGLRLLAIDGLLMFAALITIRGLRRARYEAESPGKTVPVLLAGTADRLEPLIRIMLRSRTIGLRPLAAFCPGEPHSARNLCHDVPIFSGYGELTESACLDKVKEVHVVGDPGELLQGAELLLEAKNRDLRVRLIPPVWDSREWRARRSFESAAEAMLKRQAIVTDAARLAETYRGKCALVTGGAGSIGSQIVRTLASAGAGRIVAFDLSENALCYLAEEIRATHPEVRFRPVVGNILDPDAMADLMGEERPEFVFHAAARKHVNFMETAVTEAVRFNVEGTFEAARAARNAGVGTFVFISTDKAVHPTNVMGATKLLAERLLRLLAGEGPTRFAAVRFGNVLGSEGSIVPILKRQIARGGPVTITHPEVERFFITVREAAELVLQAGSMATGGETFILEMGEPVRIIDLARNMAALHGLDLDEVGVTITGLKPGEKLTERLWNRDEEPAPSPAPGILMARGGSWGMPNMGALTELLESAGRGAATETLSRLMTLVPEYAPSLEAIRAAAHRGAGGGAQGQVFALGTGTDGQGSPGTEREAVSIRG